MSLRGPLHYTCRDDGTETILWGEPERRCEDSNRHLLIRQQSGNFTIEGPCGERATQEGIETALVELLFELVRETREGRRHYDVLHGLPPQEEAQWA